MYRTIHQSTMSNYPRGKTKPEQKEKRSDTGPEIPNSVTLPEKILVLGRERESLGGERSRGRGEHGTGR